jgi:hypothetical protein
MCFTLTRDESPVRIPDFFLKFKIVGLEPVDEMKMLKVGKYGFRRTLSLPVQKCLTSDIRVETLREPTTICSHIGQ